MPSFRFSSQITGQHEVHYVQHLIPSLILKVSFFAAFSLRLLVAKHSNTEVFLDSDQPLDLKIHHLKMFTALEPKHPPCFGKDKIILADLADFFWFSMIKLKGWPFGGLHSRWCDHFFLGRGQGSEVRTTVRRSFWRILWKVDGSVWDCYCWVFFLLKQDFLTLNSIIVGYLFIFKYL